MLTFRGCFSKGLLKKGHKQNRTNERHLTGAVSNKRNMNILIADGHIHIREGVEQILRTIQEVESVEVVANGNDALNKMRESKYDIAIMDISTPGLSGLDILQQLKRLKNQTQILLYSFCPEKQYAMSALRLGAAGYLSNDSVYEELTTAIRHITKGGRYVSAETSTN